MTKTDTIQLLSWIKVAYPHAFNRIGKEDAKAIVNLWHSTYASVPLYIMKQALQNHVLNSKFPPVIADINQELRSIHFSTANAIWIQESLGLTDLIKENMQIIHATEVFAQDVISFPQIGYDCFSESITSNHASPIALLEDETNKFD